MEESVFITYLNKSKTISTKKKRKLSKECRGTCSGREKGLEIGPCRGRGWDEESK